MIPVLDQPLIPDDYRSAELQRRLGVDFLGRNEWTDVRSFVDTVDRQLLLEKRVEAALVDDGYDPNTILQRRHQIRGILFNHPELRFPSGLSVDI